MGTVFVLPAFNEQQSIVPLVTEILESYPTTHVIVVDDGSSDRTADVVKDSFSSDQRITLVRHEVNRGLGAAMATGISESIERGDQWNIMVSLDSDGTHPPAAAADLICGVESGYDLVAASRYRPGSRVLGVPWYRRFLSMGARLLVRLMVGTSAVRDVTCGYRAYDIALLRRLSDAWGDDLISHTDFSCQLELLLKALSMGAKCSEEPFELRYDLKQGQSKINFRRTVRSSLQLLLAHRLGKLKPRANG